MLKWSPIFLVIFLMTTGCTKPASGPIGPIGIDLPSDENAPVNVNPNPVISSSSSTTSSTVITHLISPSNDTTSTTIPASPSSFDGSSTTTIVDKSTSSSTSSSTTTSSTLSSTIPNSTLNPVTTSTVSASNGREPSSQPTVKVFSAPVLMLRNVGQQYQTQMNTAPGN